MYCSTCGGAVTRGLTYCNHCGAKLYGPSGNETATQRELFPESLIWAIVSVSVGGLGVIIGFMAVMKQALDFNGNLIALFALLGFLLLMSAEIVFIWLLVRRTKSKEANISLPSGSDTKELVGAPMRSLSEPVQSVTDSTTRNLEPVYRERN